MTGPSAVEAGIGAEPLKRANPGVVKRRGSPTSTSNSATERVESPQSRSSVLGLALRAGRARGRPLAPRRPGARSVCGSRPAAAAAARARGRRGAIAGARARPCEHLARDPLGVKRVGLTALASAIGTRGAARAHVAHVLVVSGQEHGRVPAPPGRVLDPPARDRPERPRPRHQRPMPLTRDPEMLARQKPAARVEHRRRQRPLVRVDADHIARVIGRQQHMRGPGSRRLQAAITRSLLAHPAIPSATADRPTRPRWARELAKRSSQAKLILEGHNQGRHFVTKTPRQRVRQLASQTPVEPSTLRQPSPTRGTTNYNTATVTGEDQEHPRRMCAPWSFYCLWQRCARGGSGV